MSTENFKFTKRHITIFQTGRPIFDCDVWVCLEDTNYCNVASPYFFSTDRNKRTLKFKLAEGDSELCVVSLGFGDTFIVTIPQ